ncbi:hypothetical protein DL768_007767 [Monosporascus sp. mg162]|nr:hypothetical protein DL768_007767 [Monosporascus sp. mg162]
MAAPLKSAIAGSASAGFVPRKVFEVSPSIVRSYFLGHHAGALTSMRKILSNIGLILECRDSRVPLTSSNPLLESSLAGRDRIIVYTKEDLCAPAGGANRRSQKNHANRWPENQKRLLREWHSSRHHGGGTSSNTGAIGTAGEAGSSPRGAVEGTGPDPGSGGRTEVVFTNKWDPRTIARLLDTIKGRARASDSLLGLRALIVGMPNSGKSTLLNSLRHVGVRLPSAASTGAQPGVTRKLSTPVRVAEPDSAAGIEGGVYVVDAPGVFVPYVGDVEAMLKLALVGCVKDGVVPAETLADYLLFRLNLVSPELYADLSPAGPTNDAREFLEAVARRTGKLLRGGEPALEQAADWVVQQWRKGALGRFCLDDLTEEGMRDWEARAAAAEEKISMSQARKREKEARRAKGAAKRQAAAKGA